MTCEKRREPRYDVAVDASFRNGRGSSQRVKLSNLSTRGCRFASGQRMGPDAFLTLTMGSLDFIDARVTWRDGNVHGIRFLQPLHPAVLQHVCSFLSSKPAELVAHRAGSA